MKCILLGKFILQSYYEHNLNDFHLGNVLAIVTLFYIWTIYNDRYKLYDIFPNKYIGY